MVNYMKSIGMQHLTMSNEERAVYESALFLFVKMVPHVRRWRRRFREKKAQAKIAATLRGFIARERMNWMLEKPLSLAENP